MSEDLQQASIETHTGPSPAGGGARARAHRAGDIVADKYVLVRFLARGGMAEVWLGTHASLKTDVAIKFMDPKLATDPAAGPYVLERFRFEAQLSARLGARTRQVVAVHDAGEHEGAPYLVMEYVPGRTLDAEVEASGPLLPARFADVLEQVADALGAAHSLGVIHRDLKPSNLLLVDDPDGKLTVKVADFGVAKAFGTTLTLDRPRETQEGEMVGSPAFMSPEQARGVGKLDARSDVWSLGVVAYETLTGKACFDGLTLLDVFAAITMARYTPASTAKPDLPRGIDAWFGRALVTDPDARFESVEEMAKAFRALLAPRRAPRGVFAAAAVVAAIALTAVFLARGRADAKPPATAGSAAPIAAMKSGPSVPSSGPTTLPTAAMGETPKPPPQPTVDDRRGGRGTRPKASATATASAVPVAPPPPVQPVSPPVAPPPPAPTTPRSNSKGINPSEIQ